LFYFSGSAWTSTGALYAADHLQWKTCSLNNSGCETAIEEKYCTMSGGVCRPYIDAYYIEVTLCTIAGIIWFIWKYRKIIYLQNLPISAWQVRSSRQRRQFSDDDDDNNQSSVLTA